MTDTAQTTRSPDYARQMNEICPGYPCENCGKVTRECGSFKRCIAYRRWMAIVWSRTRENVRRKTHTTEKQK